MMTLAALAALVTFPMVAFIVNPEASGNKFRDKRVLVFIRLRVVHWQRQRG